MIKQITAAVMLLIFVGFVAFLEHTKPEIKMFSQPKIVAVGETKFFWSNVLVDSIIIYQENLRPKRVGKIMPPKLNFIPNENGIYNYVSYFHNGNMHGGYYFIVK